MGLQANRSPCGERPVQTGVNRQRTIPGAKMPVSSLTLYCGELVKGLALLRCLNWLLERLGRLFHQILLQ